MICVCGLEVTTERRKDDRRNLFEMRICTKFGKGNWMGRTNMRGERLTSQVSRRKGGWVKWETESKQKTIQSGRAPGFGGKTGCSQDGVM